MMIGSPLLAGGSSMLAWYPEKEDSRSEGDQERSGGLVVAIN
jgi:hypothetical protein